MGASAEAGASSIPSMTVTVHRILGRGSQDVHASSPRGRGVGRTTPFSEKKSWMREESLIIFPSLGTHSGERGTMSLIRELVLEVCVALAAEMRQLHRKKFGK